MIGKCSKAFRPVLLAAGLAGAGAMSDLAALGEGEPSEGEGRPGFSEVGRSAEAERVLLDLVLKQRRLFEIISERPEMLSEADLEARVLELVDGFRGYNSRFPDDVEGLILEAKLLQMVEQRDAAFQIYLHVDSLNPDLAVVKQQIGNYLAEEGKALAALPFLFRAVDLGWEEAVYHYSLGELLHAFGEKYISEGILSRPELDRAMQTAFLEASGREPASFDLFLRYGESFYDVETPDWQVALKHWRAGEERFTGVFQEEVILLHQARVLVELERYHDARERLSYVRHSALRASRDGLHARIDAVLGE